MKQPFKGDEAKERLLVWKTTRPDLWQNVSAQMKADVERYEQAKQAAAHAGLPTMGSPGAVQAALEREQVRHRQQVSRQWRSQREQRS
jgi:hypothetical protein